MNRTTRPADQPSPASTVHSQRTQAITIWAAGLLAVAAFFAVIHLAERDADDAGRMAAANAQMDQMQKRLDKAAEDLCRAELGPGAQVLWTADGDLVCRPPVVVAQSADSTTN